MDQSTVSMVAASATGVLGEYNHSFSIGVDDDFVILYGPNGVGKTKFLEIVDAVTRLRAETLLSLPFGHADLTYSDGSRLRAIRIQQNGSRDQESGAADVKAYDIRIELSRPNHNPVSWDFISDGFEEWASDHLPFRPLNDGLWEDPNDGEILLLDELRARYNRGRKSDEVPPELTEFIKLVPSFLIETQRLRIEQAPRPHSGSLLQRRIAMAKQQPPSRISGQAEKIKSLLNVAQTDHSRITQRLDRKFPSRVLSETISGDFDSNAIRARYSEQNEFRSRLARVASVALDDELELPSRILEDWELRLLKRYLDDAAEKLSPFVELLEKVELLEEIINSRLLNKRLEVTDKAGLSVTHTESGRSIPLDALSSGEQHEIILMIDLLFNVPRGAIVLVDEPEISLHVVWQMAFIPDVRRIAELAGFRFVVATHSPQIINDEWDRAVRLGPSEVAFA